MFSIRLDKQASIMHIKPTKLKDEVRRRKKNLLHKYRNGVVALRNGNDDDAGYDDDDNTENSTQAHTQRTSVKLLDLQTANTGRNNIDANETE